LAAFAIALTFFGASAAYGQDALMDQARGFMLQGNKNQAFDLLSPHELERAGNPSFDYLLGIAALDTGQITRAIFALERVLAMEPTNNLARAELARAYLAAGEAPAARRELKLAREGNIPPDAAASIDRVLGALEQETVRADSAPFRGYIEAFGGGDSNVNSATAAGQFAIPAFGGLILTLAPESRRRGDLFGGVGAGAATQLTFRPGWTFNGVANARGSFNQRSNDVDTSQADASAGLSYGAISDVYSFALQANTYRIDDQRYRNAAGASGQWQHTLDPASQVSAFTQWSHLTYAADESRNADRTVVGISYARAFDDGNKIVYGSVFAADEAQNAHAYANYGHHATGIRFGGEYSAGQKTTWFSALQYEDRRYGGTEPFFDTTRHDRQLDVALGVRFIPAPLWRITPQISYTRSSSNVVLYDYTRTVVQITVRREFQ